MPDLRERPHRRFNPLRKEWVVVSPNRNRRPWHGSVEPVQPERPVVHDPDCDLCPGNVRKDGGRNPRYESTFAFDNGFPALVLDDSSARADEGGLLVAEPERGVCRVMCFSPRHDLTLARMNVASIRAVVDAWAAEYDALAAVDDLAYVTVFENRGAVMGASNPHPHCQIWATEHVPNDPAVEIASMTIHRARRGSCLLCDYLALEVAAGERVVCENDAFAAVVPFWAAWPFEALVMSRRHTGTISSLDNAERSALADILKQLTTRYDNVFETPFPYSMGFHQQPLRGASPDVSHLHAHFYPPLLRSATIRKFMVGFELLGSPQRDFTPEDAAARLKSTATVHYLDRASGGQAQTPDMQSVTT